MYRFDALDTIENIIESVEMARNNKKELQDRVRVLIRY